MTDRVKIAMQVWGDIYREYCRDIRDDKHAPCPDWRQGLAWDALKVADSIIELGDARPKEVIK